MISNENKDDKEWKQRYSERIKKFANTRDNVNDSHHVDDEFETVPKSMIMKKHLPELNKIIPYTAQFMDHSQRTSQRKKTCQKRKKLYILQ